MLFLNRYEIDEAAARYVSHPVLGPATRTLRNLRDAADDNSDGWAYYPKPARAAANLQKLIQGSGQTPCPFPWDTDRADVTPEAYRATLRPVKAFRTRSGWSFDIEGEG